MKKIYAFLIFASISVENNAQIVNIPDVNLKNILIFKGVDHNQDGEIQVSEALSYTYVNVNGPQYVDGIDDITDMTGIEAFANLTQLYCDGNDLTSLDVSALTNLQKLSCRSNQLTTINVTGLTSLTVLDCYSNNLTNIDVSTLTNLQRLTFSSNQLPFINLSDATALSYLECDSNLLTELNVTDNLNLKSIRCHYNSITSLDVNNLVNLETLSCGSNLIGSLQVNGLSNLTSLSCNNNQITTLDLTELNSLTSLNFAYNSMTSFDASNFTNLTTLSCYENQLASLNVSNLANLVSLEAGSNLLTSIDLNGATGLRNIQLYENLFTALDFTPIVATSGSPYMRYYIYNNPNLTFVNLKNGGRLRYTSGPGAPHINSFNASGCPNLAYVCADDVNFGNIIDSVPDVLLNSYCSFTPGGNHNTITGTFTLDLDNDGCDTDDYHFQHGKILVDDSVGTRATFTDAEGDYMFYNTQPGSFVLTPVFEHPYFTISPQSATLTFTDNNNNSQTQNFCITPNGVHNDVEITIMSLQLPRPGFDAQYQLTYKNKGNQIISGNITLNFDDAALDFVSSNTAPANQGLNSLNWIYENLLPFESRVINVTLNVNSPQETPPVNNGDLLSFIAVINPVSGDSAADDNTFALRETVVGSFDPNDKTCLEGATITPEEVGNYLHYLIRFENSGTAAAENIVVLDMIDTDKFDTASLQLVSSSHPHSTRISGNKVEFIFEGINLPAGIDDESGSHGYVAFKVKTKNTLVIGDIAENTANIYFDYNFPITTNTAVTTVSALGRNEFINTSVSVYPNPVKEELHITSKQNITSIQLYDFQGRLIEARLTNGSNVTFNTGKNATGIYFVKIYTENGVKVEKIIKE